MILALKHTDQLNKIKSPQRNFCIYGQLIINKGTKTNQLGKIVSSQMALGKLDKHIQKNETEPLFYITHKN